MIAFDYRDCGPAREPRVVHVDQERGYAVTTLASGFAGFIRGLRAEGRVRRGLNPKSTLSSAVGWVIQIRRRGPCRSLPDR